jgi:exopolysaccharide production protein ExoZ
MRKLRSVQVLRAIAACSVVVLHSYQDLAAPVGLEGYGAFGVDLFFVISGFIIANVARERGGAAFLQDRLWRIFPMWWLAALPWLLVLPRDLTSVVSTVTLWPVYPGGYYVPILSVGWTLSFELLFYLGMTASRSLGPQAPLAAYGIALFGALLTANPLLQFIGSPMALEFLMGVILAHLPRRTIFGVLPFLGIALLAITPPSTGSAKAALIAGSALWRAVEWGLPAALIVWGKISLDPLFRHRAFNVPVAIGDASYSIYLFHPLIAYGFEVIWPVRLVLAIVSGWLVHRVVERRIMRLQPTLGFLPAGLPKAA